MDTAGPAAHAVEPAVTRRQLLAIAGAATIALSPVAAIAVPGPSAAAPAGPPAYDAIVGLL
ncbi:hypothetical protein [Nocardioides luteus]|uniref:Uncharacterized protein n=1 Tax=Nocardioides luteus TaxID=1844 RepID=A0A1J4N2G8_9ACTN|nr:hypothetical protein [Nocardioides luteus]OIJ25734.1 hypothetical protein UG56_016285 [Nocardioides luteus]